MSWLSNLLLIAGFLLIIAGVVLKLYHMPGAVMPFFPGTLSLIIGGVMKFREQKMTGKI